MWRARERLEKWGEVLRVVNEKTDMVTETEMEKQWEARGGRRGA